MCDCGKGDVGAESENYLISFQTLKKFTSYIVYVHAQMCMPRIALSVKGW